MSRNGKKKDEIEGGTATMEAPAGDAQEAPGGNPPREENKPIKVLSYCVGKDTYIQVSIWARDGSRQDGTPFVSYDTSVRKRYKDHRDRAWKSYYSFSPSELYVVQHGLQQAGGFIAELRATADVPF